MFSEQPICTDSTIVVNTVEGSTMNQTFRNEPLRVLHSHRKEYNRIDFEENKYDIISRHIINLQIKNVTSNDTGIYWIDYMSDSVFRVKLSITSM